MAKGTMIHNQPYTYVDSHTGTRVTRLTNPEIVCHHMYFYNNMITSDGKKLLYGAEMDGERQLYLMDMESGDAVCVTEGAEVSDFSGMITADDRYIIYKQGERLLRQELATGKEHCFYETPEGWTAGGDLGPSSDYKKMVIMEMRKDTAAKRKVGANWDAFAENCLAKPLCRIVYIDVETGESKVIHEERCWIGHTQLRPVYGDKVLFCHEGPYDLIDARLWCVNIDGTGLTCLREQPSDLIITHEIWMPDGESIAYVYKETTGKKEENIRMIPLNMSKQHISVNKPESEENTIADTIEAKDFLEEVIFMDCSPYAHFNVAPDGKYMAGDSQGHDVPIHMLNNVKEEVTGEVKNDFIYLVDVQARTEKKLCYHGTSWRALYGNSQDTHPHPFFTKDSKHVIYTSDADGKPALYMADIS